VGTRRYYRIAVPSLAAPSPSWSSPRCRLRGSDTPGLVRSPLLGRSGGKLFVVQRVPEIQVRCRRDAVRQVVLLENAVDIGAERQSAARSQLNPNVCQAKILSAYKLTVSGRNSVCNPYEVIGLQTPHQEIRKTLFEQGSLQFRSPLPYQGLSDGIEFLVNKGAQLDRKDQLGRTPLSISLSILTQRRLGFAAFISHVDAAGRHPSFSWNWAPPFRQIRGYRGPPAQRQVRRYATLIGCSRCWASSARSPEVRRNSATPYWPAVTCRLGWGIPC